MSLRADAQRNLDRVLDAASAAFAEGGVDVSVDEIARRAGVGHGTVFRRFPTKEALLQAVLLLRIAELEAVAETEDLAGFVRAAAAMYARDRGLVEGLEHCVGREEWDALLAAVRRLVERSHADGSLRADVSAEDLLKLVPTASLYPGIVLDGLRPPRG